MPGLSVDVELKERLENGYYSLKTLDSFFYLFFIIRQNIIDYLFSVRESKCQCGMRDFYFIFYFTPNIKG